MNVLIHHPSLPSSFLHSSFPSSFHSSFFLFDLNMLMIHLVLKSFSICIAFLLPSISPLLCHIMHFMSAHVLSCFLMPFKLNSTRLTWVVTCYMLLHHFCICLLLCSPYSLLCLLVPYSPLCIPSSSILSFPLLTPSVISSTSTSNLTSTKNWNPIWT